MRNLNIHSLRRSINNLCDFLEQEYFINHGGYCFIAYVIAKQLDKLGIAYKLIIYDYHKRNSNCIQYEVHNKVKNRTYSSSVTGNYCCSHYSLHIIGAGEVNNGRFERDMFRYSIEDIHSSNIHWIYKTSSWNSDYNRKNNKTIKNIVKMFFKKYEKN